MKSIHSIRTILMKELREFVRDKRTLLLALVLGPLITPAIMLGILTLAESRAKSQIEKPLEVAMVGVEHAPNLVKWLAGQGIRRKAFDGDLDTAIRTQAEDVYLRIGEDFEKDWREGSPATSVRSRRRWGRRCSPTGCSPISRRSASVTCSSTRAARPTSTG